MHLGAGAEGRDGGAQVQVEQRGVAMERSAAQLEQHCRRAYAPALARRTVAHHAYLFDNIRHHHRPLLRAEHLPGNLMAELRPRQSAEEGTGRTPAGHEESFPQTKLYPTRTGSVPGTMGIDADGVARRRMMRLRKRLVCLALQRDREPRQQKRSGGG